MTVRFDVLAHIQNVGDVHAGPGEYVGTRGTGLRLEGFAITLEPWTRGLGLRYRADIRGQGDTGWVTDGMFVGTRGQGRALEGFRIELSGECLADYDVLYMANISGGGDIGWLANGEYCGLRGQGRHIGGLAIRIMPRRPDFGALASKAASRNGKPLAITASASPRSTGVAVSALDGSDLQTWDRRPVRGAEGYALINRARPSMCIARGPGPEAVLKHVSEIDTNDRCVWLDDTVPGAWNAIRSKTELELKLNMRGDPPYADQGNALIVHPWSRAAANELWQPRKLGCDLIGGTDAVAPSDILRAIYRSCYPDLFKGELTFQSTDIGRIAFDLAYAPMVRVPSSDIPVDPADPSSLAAFMVAFDGIELTVEGAGGAWTATASLEMLARVRFHTYGSPPVYMMTLELRQGLLRVERHPEAEARLNELLVPWLIAHFNLQIFAPLRIPVIGLPGNQFSAPVVTVQPPCVTAAFAKAPHATIAPRPTAWPFGRALTGIGTSTLDTVLGEVLAGIDVYDSWTYKDPGRSFNLLVYYRIHLGNPRFTIFPSSGNQCQLRIDLRGDGVFEIRHDFSPRVWSDGYVNCSARLTVKDDKTIDVVVESIDAIVFDWSADGEVYPDVMLAFGVATGKVASDYLRGRSFTLYTPPTIKVGIAGRNFEITLRDLEVGSFADAEQRPMALVTGMAAVAVK
ncbi:hypothetical protein [Dyella subtropica]|uniref:hypothetical protein n=1 Tax=Dyella subtropica TaxID=2992127 RepID=UPI00225BEEC0|nr:hypothetical protein [Dyella subtropica]